MPKLNCLALQVAQLRGRIEKVRTEKGLGSNVDHVMTVIQVLSSPASSLLLSILELSYTKVYGP